MILDMWMLLELFESKVLVEIWNANNIHMGPPCVCMRHHGYGCTRIRLRGAPRTHSCLSLPNARVNKWSELANIDLTLCLTDTMKIPASFLMNSRA